ncbi:phage regulatory CII family protein [Enterobacter cloacae]|uniref:GPW/gp25 family protein n=1 Tax=Enterobacter cloacae complex TaxID=354276 RepID=UPI002984CB48|nr:hypothetical protein [Enterobacter cloacae]HCB2125185.1 phage regulatory CII family protein [Enterobacter cloacae]HCT2370208.1 phage regulatory CII family protein [Enterobacter cloacae]HDQ2828752.1 phage regulatory CII family protein [Enterobacter cloacae]
MFDFQISKHSHYDDACRVFAQRHNMAKLIDQPQTPALRLQIMAACYSAIQKWEPRVSLTTITFERSETDGGLYVDITGNRSTGGQPFSLTIPLS